MISFVNKFRLNSNGTDATCYAWISIEPWSLV